MLQERIVERDSFGALARMPGGRRHAGGMEACCARRFWATAGCEFISKKRLIKISDRVATVRREGKGKG